MCVSGRSAARLCSSAETVHASRPLCGPPDPVRCSLSDAADVSAGDDMGVVEEGITETEPRSMIESMPPYQHSARVPVSVW